ncbi:MAG: anion transporter [Candidatus Eisenbacteria bacterium]|uniref:Anion transporter n=1 Tax=Eiseniibacteriota bacterium TaxID=2212470 RepID=A0A849SWH8_UNCEI|nr:anion transporter [Candidatus Eisenbacteria bacterium]
MVPRAQTSPDRTPPIDPEEPLGPTRHFKPVPILLSVLAAFIVAQLRIPHLGPAAHDTLTILTLAIGLWFTEAVPIVVPALLIPILATMMGVTTVRGAFSGFGDPIVYMFLGTFLLTESAARHGLNARLAATVMNAHWVRGNPKHLIWALALLGCAISAFVNNTATTAMILPLALTAERTHHRGLLVGALLMAAYAPSLGGFATPVGTAPNLIGLGLLEAATGVRPSFGRWMLVFAPLAILFTIGSAAWLRWRAGSVAPVELTRDTAIPAPSIARPWSLAERLLVPVFGVVVLLWIGPGLLQSMPALANAPFLELLRKRLPETVVPLFGGLLLFLLPSGGPGAGGRRGWRNGERILDVSVFRRLEWSTLLLFGGGLSLGVMMFDTGLAHWIGGGLANLLRLEGTPLAGTFGVVLVSTLLGVLVSEITSNTASASLVVPVAIALAQVAGVDPVKPALAATVACSFGFMLPVSTPPNALVYSTGRLRVREMIANGALLDLAGIAVVSVWVTLFA